MYGRWKSHQAACHRAQGNVDQVEEQLNGAKQILTQHYEKLEELVNQLQDADAEFREASKLNMAEVSGGGQASPKKKEPKDKLVESTVANLQKNFEGFFKDQGVDESTCDDAGRSIKLYIDEFMATMVQHTQTLAEVASKAKEREVAEATAAAANSNGSSSSQPQSQQQDQNLQQQMHKAKDRQQEYEWGDDDIEDDDEVDELKFGFGNPWRTEDAQAKSPGGGKGGKRNAIDQLDPQLMEQQWEADAKATAQSPAITEGSDSGLLTPVSSRKSTATAAHCESEPPRRRRSRTPIRDKDEDDAVVAATLTAAAAATAAAEAAATGATEATLQSATSEGTAAATTPDAESLRQRQDQGRSSGSESTAQ